MGQLISQPRIQEGRRRVCITDGRGTLYGGGSASRVEDDLAKKALWVYLVTACV